MTNFRCNIFHIILLWAFVFTVYSDDTTQKNKMEAVYNSIKKKYPTVPEINAEEAMKKKDVCIIDVRDANERAVSMIKGAITLEEFAKDSASLHDKTIILYCTVGARSGKAAEDLQKKGFTKAYNLVGGVLGWAHAQGAFVTAKNEETKKVHTWSADFNYLPENYVMALK